MENVQKGNCGVLKDADMNTTIALPVGAQQGKRAAPDQENDSSQATTTPKKANKRL